MSSRSEKHLSRKKNPDKCGALGKATQIGEYWSARCNPPIGIVSSNALSICFAKYIFSKSEQGAEGKREPMAELFAGVEADPADPAERIRVADHAQSHVGQLVLRRR
jgi:hypothetical protein